MISFFLNSQLKSIMIYLRKYNFITVACVCFFVMGAALYSQTVQEELSLLSVDECEEILSNYYRTNIIDIMPIFENLALASGQLSSILSNKVPTASRNIETENRLLVHYLEYAKIISTAYIFGSINKYARRVNKIENEIYSFIEKAKLTPDVYLKFADYLYTKISLPKNFNIISSLPILYRKTLLKAHDNNEALVKLACWHIAAADETTSNFCGFIETAEDYIEELNEVDQFMSFIWYSIYYMKKYEVKKGWGYFQKAKEIFPNHVWLLHLYNNYQNGILGL